RRAAALTFATFQRQAALRDLHSFPTRRSSDLLCASNLHEQRQHSRHRRPDDRNAILRRVILHLPDDGIALRQQLVKIFLDIVLRSEEHTSELQSLAYLVCRLLLEKKKIHHYIV